MSRRLRVYKEILKAVNQGFEITFKSDFIFGGIVIEARKQYGDKPPIVNTWPVMLVETEMSSAESYAGFAVSEVVKQSYRDYQDNMGDSGSELPDLG
jgi:hypothetical protein